MVFYSSSEYEESYKFPLIEAKDGVSGRTQMETT